MNTKDKLIVSALKLFNQKWFESTSTTSICTDAGFSSGALFVHFKTKNDLLDFLYIDIKKNYFNYVFNNIYSEDDLELLFTEILKKSFEYYLNDFDKFIFVDRFANSHHISRIAKQEVASDMNAFIELLNKWKEQWLFINESNDVLLVILSATFHGLVKYIHDNDIKNYDDIIPLVIKWIRL